MPQASAPPSPTPADRSPTTMRSQLRRLAHACTPRSSRATTARPAGPRRSRRQSSWRPSRVPRVARDHLGEERRRQIARRCRASRARVTVLRGSAISRFSSGDRPRRRRHHAARMRAEPQAELQHVPGRLRHGAIWRARRTRRHRTAARAGCRDLGREDLRHRAVRPHELPLRGLEARPLVAR